MDQSPLAHIQELNALILKWKTLRYICEQYSCMYVLIHAYRVSSFAMGSILCITCVCNLHELYRAVILANNTRRVVRVFKFSQILIIY
jgi:hypothetical protein